MGEIADHYIDRMLDGSKYPKFNQFNQKKKATWTTSTGVVYEPHNMEDSHLLNCIHLCERREGNKGIKYLNNAPTYIAMVDELISRGCLNQDYYLKTLEERKKVKI
jgi:hypothetical protein